MTRQSSGRRHARRDLGVLLLLTVLLLTTAVPATAAIPGHTGTRGVHVLIDSPEYPGQICQYDLSAPGAMHRIAVRRPVILAPDVTAGRDRRWVGWRFRLQRSVDGETWSTFHTSSIRTALAYDDQPAPLKSRGRDFTGLAGYQYQTAVDLYWYTPTSKTTKTGQATHTTLYSLYSGPVEVPVGGSCPGALATTAITAVAATAAPAVGTHSDDMGLHTLIDSPREFPGVSCVYNGDRRLVRIRVRAPVVYAQDTYAGAQQVRWRFEVVGANEALLFTPVHTSTWTTASATQLMAARWRGRTLAVDGSDWDYWVVRVRMEWLGAGTPRPYALHGAYHRTGDDVFGYCFG